MLTAVLTAVRSVPSAARLGAAVFPCLAALLLGGSALSGQAVTEAEPAESKLQPPPGMDSFDEKQLLTWVTFLASDALGGRLTGSPGQHAAAKYIADHFTKLGLEPLGDEQKSTDGKVTRSYLQRYPLKRTYLDMQATGIELAEPKQGFSRGFAVIPQKGGGAVEAAGEFVYAGLVRSRGIKAGVDLEDWTGKIPVLVLQEPSRRAVGVERQMMMGMMQLMGPALQRARSFARKGAKAVVLANLDDDAPVPNVLTYMSVGPGQDMMVRTGGFGGMGAMMLQLGGEAPLVFTSRKVSLALLGAIGLAKEAAGKPQEDEQVAKFARPKGTVRVSVKTDDNAFATNVVAVLRGSDPQLAKQAIVFSAHQDHVGTRLDGDVFNGADDNASGSTGLMAIAQAFVKSGVKPRRSIVFLSVSGEELGLWGSDHYANHPTWPIEDIVADINTDMIGRSGPESGPKEVTVTPSFKHRKFSTLVRDASRIGAKLGMSFQNGDKYYTRSDHYNFARKGVPVVFFCNGEHDDYHQVSDTADKIDVGKLARIAKIAYWTGFAAAQHDARPETLGRRADWSGAEQK
ncbi:MAG: M28 family peptidase [Planctomycetes bacterium]|nr:M28 family peptidase [Planctomycetota bacterium]